MKQEEFITKKPQSAFLQQYISYYYFHHSSIKNGRNKFIFYPNINCALTIYKNSKVTFKDNFSKSEPDTNTDFSFLYPGIVKQFMTSEMIAPFNKIGIVFKILGINHFISETLSTIITHPVDKHFDYFGKDLIYSCESIYSTKEIDKKVNLLDAFFEDHFCDFSDDKFKNCIHAILDSKRKLTVTEVSERSEINKKTLLRLFKKHLCCTTKEYLNIVLFRKSLNDYLLLNKNFSLTALALDNQYYDQSQFIRHFKSLSGKNPKAFFEDVELIGNEDLFWTFT